MINITFPDGAVREYEKGSSPLDIAKQISEGLARKVLTAEVNGEVWDATRSINEDAKIKFLTWDDEKAKSTFWHSSAHLMAEAVEGMFPNNWLNSLKWHTLRLTDDGLAKQPGLLPFRVEIGDFYPPVSTPQVDVGESWRPTTSVPFDCIWLAGDASQSVFLL